MLAHLWNVRKDSVILTDKVERLINRALALLQRGCLEFKDFEITAYGDHYLPWEPDFEPTDLGGRYMIRRLLR